MNSVSLFITLQSSKICEIDAMELSIFIHKKKLIHRMSRSTNPTNNINLSNYEITNQAHKWLNYKIQYADISIKIFTGYKRYNKITKRKG